MKLSAHKVGAVFYVLWGLVHVIAGVVVLYALQSDGVGAALGKLGNAVPAGELPQGLSGIANSPIALMSWDLIWFGSLVAVLAVTLNWKNSRTGFWINLGIVLVTDLAYTFAVIVPGYVAFPRGFMGPPLGVLAIVFSTIGLASRTTDDVASTY